MNVIFSEHSKGFRTKVNKMLVDDYEAEFNAIFGEFEDKKLPRDDLYFQIKSEQDQ